MTTPWRAAADVLDPPPRPSAWRHGDPNAERAIDRPARPEQLAPPGDWFVWLILAGRGFGKTRTGAEYTVEQLLGNRGWRWAVAAPTFGDARDTCMEGDSGILAILDREKVRYRWNRSIGELTVLETESRVKLFSADEPDRFRGPQHHGAWPDELAAWQYPDAWDQLMFGLRLGAKPRVVVTTTPRPIRLVRDLVLRGGRDVHLTKGSTFDNARNLAPAALNELRERYEGTRLGRQELNAEILDDVPGALWTLAQLDTLRIARDNGLARVVVGIDPAATSGEHSDETGIIVAAKGDDGHAYVLADRSCRLSPDGWGRRAIAAHEEFAADKIVAEVNNGGEMVEHVIRTVDRNVKVRSVHASRGKRVRAEPVAALYEQGKVHHAGSFPELEDQMCSWTPESGTSPDRLDALVWALTDLMLEQRTPVFLGAV